MTNRPADENPAIHPMAAHCTNCGERFLPSAVFCGSCGTARQVSSAPLPDPHFSVDTAATGLPTVAAYDEQFPALSAASEPHPRLVRTRAARTRSVTIASVVALAVASGAAVGIVMTRQQVVALPEPAISPAAVANAQPATTTPSQPVGATLSTSPSPTASAKNFSDLYREVSSGVVRIQATTCDGGGVGTGFLIASNLVATAAHVVNDSAALNLTVGEKGAGGTTSGVVVGIDFQADVALVRLDRPIRGHVFTVTTSTPRVGQEVAAIGFPVGDPMTFTRGTVSGLDRTITIEKVMRSGMIETDAAVNPGNSGGPLLSADGQVVGLVDAKHMKAEGIAYAVAPAVANPLLKSWTDNTASAVSARCTAPAGPEQGRDLTPMLPTSPDTTTQAVGQVFKTYFDSINSANYEKAWSMLSPKLQGPSSSSFAKGTATSYDDQVVLLSVIPGPGQTVIAHVTFTSVQAASKGPNGDTCDNWDLDYTLVPLGESWLIDGAKGHNDGPTHTTC